MLNFSYAASIQMLLALLAVMLSVGYAQAASITTYNTGVDDFGVPLAENASDRHYQLIAGPAEIGAPFATTSAGGYPVPPWIPDNNVSAWISPFTRADGPVGAYRFRTTFDLSDFDASSAILTGRWAADNYGYIFLNGCDLRSCGYGTFDPNTGFGGFTDFSITRGFSQGINNLDFIVINTGWAVGLRVEYGGTADSVPEPALLSLLGLGLASLAITRRRRITK